MDMEGLHSFITVAREKSISKAAQSLHVTQPTLSARLRKLEEGLGVKLLERNWDGIRLTKEGRFFLSYSVQLFQELEEASALLRKKEKRELEGPFDAVTDSRRLKIGIESFFHPAFMSPILEGVRAVTPDLECKFVHKDSDLLLNLLECGSLDICIHMSTFSGRNGRRTEVTPRPDWNSVFLMTERLVILTPTDVYPRIENDLSNLPLLRNKPFVLFENSPLLRYQEITEKVFVDLYGGVPDKFHIVNDVESCLSIVTQGFGHTFLPGMSIAHLMDRPLPFNAVIAYNYDFVRSPVHITSSPGPESAHPLGDIVREIHAALQSFIRNIYDEPIE